MQVLAPACQSRPLERRVWGVPAPWDARGLRGAAFQGAEKSAGQLLPQRGVDLEATLEIGAVQNK